ncbi:hypothetical protein MmiAt1_08550 [Methanimicrococcus sp. At1]|uniref:DUF3795 domain-containing protein n=1 Tax=Methanimicrococcus hacksteinii TaxID=3028293 RepID=A0ABU3VPF3_9EURY|nr:DUF3795 domain-containing protein [Methanimicrococcus sp. At1]MDV0445287.1 hypothetical protein [Methanimicrococcus sp. At1]
MEYFQRQYPMLAACGLNCGLCPRRHTDGPSKCPGCAGKGFSEKHPSCGHLSCVQRRSIEYCFQCDEYPCKRFDAAVLFDSFITHRNMMTNFDKIKKEGLEAYQAELNEKIEILQTLLNGYDDGRRKSFYCTAVNLSELSEIKSVTDTLAAETNPEDSLKEKAAAAVRLFQEAADKNNIDLKLRKKEPVRKKIDQNQPE